MMNDANASADGQARPLAGQVTRDPGSEFIQSRIVVVDDQEANLQVLQGMLGDVGYDVVPATSGARALRLIIAQPPDLILLDAMMPEMDGFEVCRQIRAKPELGEIPIIFLSAIDDKAFVVRALDYGAVDYLTKPFNRAELLSRVKTHLALKQARDRLRRIAEDKDELLGILAHDLKNYLGAMQMSAQILNGWASKLEDAAMTKMSVNILNASDQMFSYVKEFLANSAADRGYALKLEQIAITDPLSSAVQRYSEAARRKSLVFREDYPAESPLVSADRGALEQVIDNLVSNAVKFSPPDRSIWLSIVIASDGWTEMRVRDEGPGCDEHDHANMFARYRRLSARPTGGESSTGLGLSIAKRHMNGMNGELRCESEFGHGATFVVCFPAGR
jgi:two-component system, sensor histidine kinase and response regulator